jgi:hypothetical protein
MPQASGRASSKSPTPGGQVVRLILQVCSPSCAINSIFAIIRTTGAIGRLWTDAMADVRTQVADLPALARDAERAEIEEILVRDRACFLVGESGSGKSALAKQIAETRYGRCAWFADAAPDYDNDAAFERGIDITHPFPEIVCTSPKPCLIVFDSIERYSARARRLTQRFMQAVLADEGSRHVHVLVTNQFEPAEKIIRRFIEAGLPPALHKAKALGLPAADDIRNLVAPIGELQWLSLRPELRPLAHESENSRLGGGGGAQRSSHQPRIQLWGHTSY